MKDLVDAINGVELTAMLLSTIWLFATDHYIAGFINLAFLIYAVDCYVKKEKKDGDSKEGIGPTT